MYSNNMRLKIVVLILVFGWIFIPTVTFAETNPPVTNHGISGTAGQLGWYRSSLDVTLTVTDDLNGVARTTYWIDSGTPVVTNFTSGSVNSFLNNSFEGAKAGKINNWYEGLGGFVIYYQSNFTSYDANKSAAIAFLNLNSNNYFYWYNEPYSVEMPVGRLIEISAWTRTLMLPGDLAYMQVWGEDVNGNNDVLLGTSNTIVGFNWSWKQVLAQVTIPAVTNYVYVKLGTNATPAAIIYWDYVTTRPVGADLKSLSFNHSMEGDHVLHYFSVDTGGNIEAEKTTNLKIDSIVPNPWQNFSAVQDGCAHCYDSRVEVQDITSGVDVSTAEYRFYTEHNAQYWGAWTPVTEVNLASNGNPVGDGETRVIEILVDNTSFGDSAHPPFRLQYKICDIAGNCGISPVYDLVAPWMTSTNGSIYIDGEILLPSPPTGNPQSYAEVFNGENVNAITSDTGWVKANYLHSVSNMSTLQDLLPEYSKLLIKAVALPSNEMPVADGIYKHSGDYELNSTTVKNAYKNADISAVVLIQGNLNIATEFVVNDNNNTVFLIDGNISVDKNVENIEGVFIATGTFDSDPSGDSRKALKIYGAVTALQGFIFPRDLGLTGPVNNSNSAAEEFIWQPRFLLDTTLSRYLNNETQRYSWQEVDEP